MWQEFCVQDDRPWEGYIANIRSKKAYSITMQLDILLRKTNEYLTIN